MKEMLDAIEISHNPPAIDYDPVQTPYTHDEIQQEMEKDNDVIKDKALSKNKKREFHLRMELKRLDADLIVMPENEKVNNYDQNKPCTMEHCRLGCVCSSLNYKRPQLLEHCGHIKCIYECSCKEQKNTSTNRLTLLSGSSPLASTITSTSTATSKLLAPLEKEFKQTVLFNNSSTMVVGRRKREIKLPERYRDSVLGREFAISELKMLGANANEEIIDSKSSCIVPQYVPVEMLFPQKTTPNTSPASKQQNMFKQFKIKPSSCVLAQDHRLTGLWVWCMIHKCYGCSCITYRPTKNLPIDLNERPDSFFYMIKQGENSEKEIENDAQNLEKLEEMEIEENDGEEIKKNICEKLSKMDRNKTEELKEEIREKFDTKDDNNILEEKLIDIKNEKVTEVKKEKLRMVRKLKLKDIVRSEQIKTETLKKLKLETDQCKEKQEDVKLNYNLIKNKNNKLYMEAVTCTCARVRLRKIDYKKRNVRNSYKELRQATLSKREIIPELIENISNNNNITIDITTPINDSLYHVKFNFLPNTKDALKTIYNVMSAFDLNDNYDGIRSGKSAYTILNWDYLQSVISDGVYSLWKSFTAQFGDILMLTGPSQKFTSPYIVNIKDWIPNILSFPPKEYYQLRTKEQLDTEIKRFVILISCKSEISGLRLLGYMDISKHFYGDEYLRRTLEYKLETVMTNALDTEMKRLQLNTSSDNNLESQVNELLFHVPLPKVTTQCRWFMVSLNQIFELLIIRKYSQAVTFNELNQALDYSAKTKRTIRIPVGKAKNRGNESPLFGIYALPNIYTRIFIGPYEMDEPSYVELYINKDGKYEQIQQNAARIDPGRVESKTNLDNHIESMLLSSKFKKTTIGTWLNTKPEEKETTTVQLRRDSLPPDELFENDNSVYLNRPRPKKEINSSKFKKVMICSTKWPEVGYFEARLYDNITYRLIHPETQVELRFTRHQNLFLWLNMYLKLDLEWGIQKFPRTTPYLKPFNFQEFEKFRPVILENNQKIENKKQKCLLPKSTSVGPSTNPNPIVPPNSILNRVSSTTHATTSTIASISSIAPSTSSNCLKTTSKIVPLIRDSSQIISTPTPYPNSKSKTLLKPFKDRPSTSSIREKSSKSFKSLKKTLERDRFEDILRRLIEKFPINDEANMKDIVHKLIKTIHEEERNEEYFRKERLHLFNQRHINILKIYRDTNGIKNNDEINQILAKLREILENKIPRERFPRLPGANRRGIKQSLYQLLFKLDPSSLKESEITPNITESEKTEVESAVSISLIPIPNESSNPTNNISSISSTPVSTTSTPTTTTRNTTTTTSSSTAESAITKLNEEEITVTYVASENKAINEKSVPLFDLTRFSDDEENDLNNKLALLKKNNQISNEALNSSNRTTTTTTTTTSSSSLQINMFKNNQTNESRTTTAPTPITTTSHSQINMKMIKNNQTDKFGGRLIFDPDKSFLHLRKNSNNLSTKYKFVTLTDSGADIKSLASLQKYMIKPNEKELTTATIKRPFTTITSSPKELSLRPSLTTTIKRPSSTITSAQQEFATATPTTIVKKTSNTITSAQLVLKKASTTMNRPTSTITSAQQEFATATPTTGTTLVKRTSNTITSAQLVFATATVTPATSTSSTATPITATIVKSTSNPITSAQLVLKTASTTIKRQSTSAQQEFAAATMTLVKRTNNPITPGQQDFATASIKRPINTVTSVEQESSVPRVPLVLEPQESAKATKLFKKDGTYYAPILKQSNNPSLTTTTTGESDSNPTTMNSGRKNLTVREILDLQNKAKLLPKIATTLHTTNEPTKIVKIKKVVSNSIPSATTTTTTTTTTTYSHLKDITRNIKDSPAPTLTIHNPNSSSTIKLQSKTNSSPSSYKLTQTNPVMPKKHLSVSLVPYRPNFTQPSILKKSASSSSNSTSSYKSPRPVILRKRKNSSSLQSPLSRTNDVVSSFSLNTDSIELKPISPNVQTSQLE